MDSLTLVALALGLSMDAMAVATARGFAARRVGTRELLLVAVWFGGAQGLMPLLGASLGSLVGPHFVAYHRWVGALVLWLVGGKMLLDAFGSDDDDDDAPSDPFAARTMLLLALATSLDAFAVGVTLPLLGAPVLTSCLVIGAITGLCSALGLSIGRRFGALFGKGLDLLGGAVLLLLGLKVLLG